MRVLVRACPLFVGADPPPRTPDRTAGDGQRSLESKLTPRSALTAALVQVVACQGCSAAIQEPWSVQRRGVRRPNMGCVPLMSMSPSQQSSAVDGKHLRVMTALVNRAAVDRSAQQATWAPTVRKPTELRLAFHLPAVLRRGPAVSVLHSATSHLYRQPGKHQDRVGGQCARPRPRRCSWMKLRAAVPAMAVAAQWDRRARRPRRWTSMTTAAAQQPRVAVEMAAGVGSEPSSNGINISYPYTVAWDGWSEGACRGASKRPSIVGASGHGLKLVWTA